MSVFLEVPEEAWVFANALAFAFRDRFIQCAQGAKLVHAAQWPTAGDSQANVRRAPGFSSGFSARGFCGLQYEHQVRIGTKGAAIVAAAMSLS